MKHITTYLAAALAALTLSSCDDFLDEAPRGNAIASTVEDYDMMFNGSQIMNLLLFEQYYTYWKNDELIFTPDCYNTIAQACSYPTSVEAAIEYRDKVYRDDENSLEWEKLYNQIYVFNSIAGGVMEATGDETAKRQLLAEARVSRAYMHFLLAQWYAMPYDKATAATETAIPIVTEANTNAAEYPLVSVEELYSWVTREMEEAVPELKEREEHSMRCYKATGYALLGKVYFFMGEYAKALEPLRSAYRLLQGDANVHLTDYREKMAPYGYSELPMMTAMSFVPFVYKDPETLYCKFNPTMRNYYLPYYNMAPTDYLRPDIYALFSDHDLRRNLISTKNTLSQPLPYPYAGTLGAHTNLGCSVPEVWLMLAECEARAGDEGEARRLLTDFRRYRMQEGYEAVPSGVTTRDELTRFAVDEQTREFVGTGYRFYNVRRLWRDPLFQDWKPITHTVGDKTFTLSETQLKLDFPETLLNWNKTWRK